MNTLINCFVPKGIEEETKRNVEALGSLDLVGEVTVIDGDIRDTKTVHRIADEARTPYTLVFLKNSYIRMGYLALERMVQIADITGAGMVYADHYQVSADGKRKDAPVIDYQQGSLRDDFNFGSVVLLRTDALKDAAARMTADYRAAGFYDLRLKLSEKYRIEHINEPLYSEVELDTRKTGEKLFDYVDPKNRASQIEMEQACTEHLKAVGAYLAPQFQNVDLDEGEFPVEASIMIPVRNRIRTIRDALKSALSQQTSFKYNVFVVENGPECHSTDGTTEAIDAIDDDRLVHIVPDRNDIGVGGAWNMALHHRSADVSSYSSTPTMSIPDRTVCKSSSTLSARNSALWSSVPTA